MCLAVCQAQGGEWPASHLPQDSCQDQDLGAQQEKKVTENCGSQGGEGVQGYSEEYQQEGWDEGLSQEEGPENDSSPHGKESQVFQMGLKAVRELVWTQECLEESFEL